MVGGHDGHPVDQGQHYVVLVGQEGRVLWQQVVADGVDVHLGKGIAAVWRLVALQLGQEVSAFLGLCI